MDAIEELIGLSTPREDAFAKWRMALETPNIRDRIAISLDHPEPGYYRIKRNNRWEPIAYWYEGRRLHCVVGVPSDDEDPCWFAATEEMHLQKAIDVWTYAWRNPVTEEAYEAVVGGGRWPDLDAAVEEQVSRPAVKGDNAPPADEIEQIKIDIENAETAVERYKVIDDDETSKAAQSARARLNELARMADKRREALVAPAIAAQREVNGKWQPLVKAAKDAAAKIGAAMGAWETKKARLQREQMEAEQRAADRAISQGVPPSTMETKSEAPPMESPAPAMKIKGGYGRAAAVIEEAVIEEVTDFRALLIFYGERPDVKDAVMRNARTDVKNGHEPPGVKITRERRVR